MKNLIKVLCIVILFFGIAGCPTSDDPLVITTSTAVSEPSGDTDDKVPIGDNGGTPSQVPEPATVLLLGSGLFGLAAFGRKRFKK